ncbi:MAG: hypothetical protein ACXITR_06620 [Cyanobacterium sp.]
MNTICNTKERLTLEQIYQQFPDQWVLIVEPQLDEQLTVISGIVVAIANDRHKLYDQLHLSKGKPSAIEYTGSTEGEAIALFL